ncbi:MAG: hypothetical protein AAF721_07370 [Myxococcota bacterium]
MGVFVAVAVFAIFMSRRLGAQGKQMFAALGGPQGSAAIQAATKGDLGPYRHLIQTTADRDARAFLADEVGRRARVDAVAAWVSAEPNSTDAQLTWGASLIAQAWEARGGGTSVSPAARQAFHEHLVQADAALQHAAAGRPDDATPWALRIVCARGLGGGRALVDGLFAEATARDPESWLAHIEMLRYLTPKWHGSDEAMLGFARGVRDRAPQGSDLHTLILAAHLERWIGLELIQGSRKQAARYVANPAVQLECTTAYDNGLGSSSLRSRLSTQAARNYAGAWFHLAKDKPRLRAEVMAIGNAFTESPWNAFAPTAEAGFRRASKWAFGV